MRFRTSSSSASASTLTNATATSIRSRSSSRPSTKECKHELPARPGNGNNPNPNNNRNNGNPFTNPFNRGNNGNNGKGNKENRPIWQSPWLWGTVLVVMVVLMFQMFAGGGTKTIDTKDGFALINQARPRTPRSRDNKQVVRLELKNDYTKKNADTGKVTNYGKNVQFYYTFAQGAQVAKAVENGDLEKGWTSNIEQTSVMSYLITSILPFVIILALFWWLMSRMGGAGGMLGMGGKKNSGKLLEGQTPTTKFADVAGEDEAVAEVEEIKDFLKDPSKYKALGARIPRGVLLYGPPGTGKRCWPEPSQVRPACRSTRWPAPTSSRCSSVSVPPVCVTCSMRPRRTLPPSSSSMRSMPWVASVAPVWAVATTSASRR